MFYTVRYNASLAALGIDPRRVNPDLRTFAQTMGNRFGLTPQEAVILTVMQFPPTIQAEIDPRLVQVWVTDGKVSLDKQSVQEAVERLGWDLVPKGW
jgi:hypothetical protein